jgi:hypothetical protein
MNAESGERRDYPVFVDGEKVGVASDLSFTIEYDVQSPIAGPLVASMGDEYSLGERMDEYTETKVVTFSIDLFVQNEEPITSLEVAIPKAGRWEITEFRSVSITERRVGQDHELTEGMAKEVSIDEIRHLGKDVDEPDIVRNGMPEDEDDGFDVTKYER